MTTNIWWIRRDLRVHDNQALIAAMQAGERIIPVFVLDPRLMRSSRVGGKRLGFLYASLRALNDDLNALGANLAIQAGDPVHVLSHLFRAYDVRRIYAEEDYTPYARQRDAEVEQSLPLTLTGGLTAHPPELVRKRDGDPYTVFSAYARTWLSLPLPPEPNPAPAHIHAVDGIHSDPIPDEKQQPRSDPFPAGEAVARLRLGEFISSNIYRYSTLRNRMDMDGTSMLSPYLRFGILSARQVIWSARQAEAGAPDSQSTSSVQAWLNELIWREFYVSILYHFPNVQRYSFREKYRQLPWLNDRAAFNAWQLGQTGYPIVDAAMRQLTHMGWMHNRARMIAASFLVKDLLVDWRWGEEHFMQELLDGDTASNNGGWQWTAGTGTDSAPYFRIFNPVLQGKKFDPNGDYVRRYVPELQNLPAKYIHEPWKMSPVQQEQFCCMIGKDYPPRIIDHAFARQRALAFYKSA